MAEAERAPNTDRADKPVAGDDWARLEIRPPLDGVILEQNVSVGDLVKVGHDLFKIADLSTLGVMAEVYEEDLPLVESLAATDRNWTIYVASHTRNVGIAGRFDVIGRVVDPRKHTATVFGWVSNAGGNLRIGQLIHAELASAAAVAASARALRRWMAGRGRLQCPSCKTQTPRGQTLPWPSVASIGLPSAEAPSAARRLLSRRARILSAPGQAIRRLTARRSTPTAASRLRPRCDETQGPIGS